VSRFLAASTNADLSKDGKQHDTISINYSSNRSAYGRIGVPFTVIRNGTGPTLLLLAGTHGDEYQGQIALRRLAKDIRPEAISGRLLILPSLNAPASYSDTRISPIDSANLFRSYAEPPTASPTPSIANFIKTELVGISDAIVDLHSGGTSLEFTACVMAFLSADESYNRRVLELGAAFGAPTLVLNHRPQPNPSSLVGIAHAAKIPMIATELGGGSLSRASDVTIGCEGVLRTMNHLGMASLEVEPAGRQRVLEAKSTNCFIYSETDGIFEPSVDIGQSVLAGQLVGYVHPLSSVVQDPVPLSFATSGTIICRRALARTLPGDCLFQVGAPEQAGA